MIRRKRADLEEVFPSAVQDHDDDDENRKQRRLMQQPGLRLFLACCLYYASLDGPRRMSEARRLVRWSAHGHPRIVWIDSFDDPGNHNYMRTIGNQSATARDLMLRKIEYPMGNGALSDEERRIRRNGPKDMPDHLEVDGCQAEDWQKAQAPSACNSIHEVDLSWYGDHDREDVNARFLYDGSWRDAWEIRQPHSGTRKENDDWYTLKTPCLRHDFNERNAERHRRDAISMERLTNSPHVVNIYGFCGHTGVFDWAGGGTLTDVIDPSAGFNPLLPNKLSPLQKLRIAAQTAKAVADVHEVDGPNHPTIAHTDVAMEQFVNVRGIIKLSDFDRARFITYRDSQQCNFRVGKNLGRYRSPEEYLYHDESEKVDVFSLGGCLYSILTDLDVFEDLRTTQAIAKIKRGHIPPVPAHVQLSESHALQTLIAAVNATMKYRPEDRISARDAQRLVQDLLRTLDPHWKLTDSIYAPEPEQVLEEKQ